MIDDGTMWATSWALHEVRLPADEDTRDGLGALVKKAVS